MTKPRTKARIAVSGAPSPLPLVACAAAAAVAMTTYFWRLAARSVWLDEAATLDFATMPLREMLTAFNEPHPPVFYTFMHVWLSIAGTGELALRGPAAAFAVAAVLLLGWAVYERRRPWLAPLAMLLMAVSPWPVQYAQNARSYTLLIAVTVATFGFLARWERTQSRRDLIGYVATAVLACYTHYFGIVTVGVQQFYLLIRIAQRRLPPRALMTGAWIAIGYLPWLPFLWLQFSRVRQQGFWLWYAPPPGLRELASTVFDFVMVGRPHHFLAGYLALVALGIAFGSRRATGSRARDKTSIEASGAVRDGMPTLLVVLWLAAPIALAFLCSWLWKPIFLNRYIIGSVPAFYVLVAAGVVALPFALVRLSTAAVLVYLGLSSLPWHYNYEPERWRALAAHLHAQQRPGDLVIVTPTYFEMPMRYYYRGPEPMEVPLDAAGETAAVEKWRNQALTTRGRLWHVTPDHPPSGRPNEATATRERYPCATVERGEYGFEVRLYLFDFATCPPDTEPSPLED